MNENFVRRVCKDYLLDRQFSSTNKDIVLEEMVTDIKGHIRDLYETDIEFYNSLWDQKKWHQQDILRHYLDLNYYTDDRFKFFENAEPDFPESLAFYSEDSDGFDFDINSTWIDSTTDKIRKIPKVARDVWVRSGSQTFVSGAADFFSGLVKMAGATILMPFKLISTIITGKLSLTAFVITTVFLITSGQGKRLGRDIGMIVGSFGNSMEKVGKSIVKNGRYFRFRYAIIQKNAAQCYKEADITKEELGLIDHFIIGKIKFPVVTERMIKTSGILQDCFIAYSIKSIGLYMQAYFICLKKTGAFQDYERMNPDELMKIISGVQLSTACQEYHAEIREYVDKFYSLLDFAYSDDTSKKTKAIMTLRDEVIQARSQIARTKNFNKFK